MKSSDRALQLVRAAFTKLKASVYFDKTALPLRDAIVKFESSVDFESNLIRIAKFLKAGGNDSFLQGVLDEIDVLAFPKSFKSESDEKHINRVISLNYSEGKAVATDMQYFIDIPVEGHILGAIWILLVGWKLDNESCGNSRGNRIKKLLKDELLSKSNWEDGIDNNPALFESYFQQYSAWRDEGLSIASDSLKSKQDVVVLTLDLQSFYYSVDITESLFFSIDLDEQEVVRRVHDSLYQILGKYSEILHSCDDTKSKGRTVLPIGFLPSGILANWALSSFDKGILDSWNPLYYGRYVDDIIIVDKVEKASMLAQRYKSSTEDNPLISNEVIEYFLMGKRRLSETFVSRSNASQFSSDDKQEKVSLESEKDCKYTVAEAYCPSSSSRLIINNKKTRILYLSHKNDSESVIETFRKQIMHNASEMRLLPDIAEGENGVDYYGELYWLDNDETVNKIRGVRDIAIDKFELSKFLGKYRIISSLTSDKQVKQFTDTLYKIFGVKELIECYLYWERVFEIFLTDKNYVGLTKFIKRIEKSINEMRCDYDHIDVERVRNALRKHLQASCNRALALVWGSKFNNDVIDAISPEYVELRSQYIETRMCNKYVVEVPLITAARYKYTSDSEVSLLEYKSIIYYAATSPASPKDECYVYEPYFEKAQDVSLDVFLCHLINAYRDESNETKENSKEASLNCVLPKVDFDDVNMSTPFLTFKEEFKIFNLSSMCLKEPTKSELLCFDIREASSKPLKSESFFSPAVSESQESLNVAIANVNISKIYSLEKVLKGRAPDRSLMRYRDLLTTFNSALRDKADMLIYPENYLPFEWLPNVINKSANEQMAIITGVEHILIGNSIYNVTAIILPFKYKGVIPTAAVFFQPKKYFAPKEKAVISSYTKRAIEAGAAFNRPIFHWKDCFFPVYCCYELTSIIERSKYISFADMLVAIEHNKDTNYFSNIIGSLARDMQCYCIQVNTSEYGDSRITQPTMTEKADIIKVKGGQNAITLIDLLDIHAIRESQLRSHDSPDGATQQFKSSPVDIDRSIVQKKIDGSLLEG